MAVKRISQFPSGVPTDNDYILFEQDGNGKSAKFGDFSLTYEEITANNIDLSGKVASAGALKSGVIKFQQKTKPVTLSDGNHTITLDIPGGITPLAIVPIGIGASESWPTKLIIHNTSTTSISFYVAAGRTQQYDIRYLVLYR